LKSFANFVPFCNIGSNKLISVYYVTCYGDVVEMGQKRRNCKTGNIFPNGRKIFPIFIRELDGISGVRQQSKCVNYS